MRRTGEASDCAYIILSQHLLHRSQPRLLGAGPRGLPKQARPFRGGSLTGHLFFVLCGRSAFCLGQLMQRGAVFVLLETVCSAGCFRRRFAALGWPIEQEERQL